MLKLKGFDPLQIERELKHNDRRRLFNRRKARNLRRWEHYLDNGHFGGRDALTA